MTEPDQSDPACETPDVVLCEKGSITRFDHGLQQCLMTLPLPGVIIFVHGVNSSGEWYEQAERGLCEGLNRRLARQPDQLKHPCREAGELHPATYCAELTPDGYIHPKMDFRTFVTPEESFSPVIRFRFGYRASAKDLKEYGRAVFLNEHQYWGGGPFANGCSSLPDLWGAGLDDGLFLWMNLQHMNPTHDRPVFAAPPRAYFVLAALRLAHLVESIRRKQADTPITIVCHSQGNMVGMTAAFLGDRMPEVSDPFGHAGRCVADSYVLCNAPYSLLESNFTETWTQLGSLDPQGRGGRQTVRARQETMKAFLEIVRGQAAAQPSDLTIDWRMANPTATGIPFTAASDRETYGMPAGPGGRTFGRATVYCNPHDQVISATSIQGIGWLGLNKAQIEATGGEGMFSQRVFAQGHVVGVQGSYDYWAHQYNHPDPDDGNFWQPPSPTAKYSIKKGVDTNETWLGRVLTALGAVFMVPLVALVKLRINAEPPKTWCIPLSAPDLPTSFIPEAVRLGRRTTDFDQGFDAPVNHLDRSKTSSDPSDAYASAKGERQGDEASEAELRYEHHAILRMRARREGLVAADADAVVEEDDPSRASPAYKKWQAETLRDIFQLGVDNHATDHSTIVTNGDHAAKALAYDVAIGICDLSKDDWRELRIEADWRFLKGLPKSNVNKIFCEYMESGKFKNEQLENWVRSDPSAAMPAKIINERGGLI